MSNNTKGVIAVLITGAIVYFVYKKFYKTGDTRSDAQIVIDKLNADFGFDKSHETFVRGAESGYITAWASAIKAKIDTFTYNNKNFSVAGGTAK